MNRPLLAAAISTLALAACGQKQETAPAAPPAPAAVVAPAPAPVATTPATEASVAGEAKPAVVDVSALPGEPKLQPK